MSSADKRVESLLDHSAQHLRDSLDEGAREFVSQDEEQALLDLVKREAPTAVSPRSAQSAFPKWPVAAAAIAAAILLLFVLRGRGGEDSPETTRGSSNPLGAEAWSVDFPRGEVDAWPLFRWEGELAAGGWSELVVTDSKSGVELARVEDPPAAGWASPSDQAWTSIQWTFSIFDATGEEIEVYSGEAWLSQP